MTDEEKQAKAQIQAQAQELQAEAAAYRKLQSLGMTDEFNELKNLLVKTIAGKMLMAFTGDKVKSYEDFLQVKGEVVARLQPLQAIGEAGALADHLEAQIKEFYLNQS